MTITTVTVSIGRNVYEAPLSDAHWSDFRKDVHASLRPHLIDLFVADALSSGKWDGITEESRTWVALISEDALPALHASLAEDARNWGQDAIAVTAGITTLVEPVEVHPETLLVNAT